MSTKQRVREMSAKNVLIDSLIEYSSYTNLTKGTVSPLDGLKLIHRRLLYVCNKICKNSKIKTAEVIGYTMSNFHPHGDMPIWTSITTLVHNGLLEGKGNWGSSINIGDDIKPAAYRYTGVKLSSKLYNLFNFIKYSIYMLNDLDKLEPLFIPTPIPISIIKWDKYTNPSMGIGFGINYNLPLLTKKEAIKIAKSKRLTKIELVGYSDMDVVYNMDDVLKKPSFKVLYKPKVIFDKNKGIIIKSPPMQWKYKTLHELKESILNIIKDDKNLSPLESVVKNADMIEKYDKQNNYNILILFTIKRGLNSKLDAVNKLCEKISELLTVSIQHRIMCHTLTIVDNLNNKEYDLLDLSRKATTFDKLKECAIIYKELVSLDPTIVKLKPPSAIMMTIKELIKTTFNMFKIVVYYSLLENLEILNKKISDTEILIVIKDTLTTYKKRITKDEYDKFVRKCVINVKKKLKKIVSEDEIRSLLSRYTIEKLLKTDFSLETLIKDKEELEEILNKENKFNGMINNLLKNIV